MSPREVLAKHNSRELSEWMVLTNIRAEEQVADQEAQKKKRDQADQARSARKVRTKGKT